MVGKYWLCADCKLIEFIFNQELEVAAKRPKVLRAGELLIKRTLTEHN